MAWTPIIGALRRGWRAAERSALLGLYETAACRRVRLLSHFGEDSQPCGNCLTQPAVQAKCLFRLRQLRRQGRIPGLAGSARKVPRGQCKDENADPGQRRRARQPRVQPGAGAEARRGGAQGPVLRLPYRPAFWRVDHESHGSLKLTEASRPVLRGEQAIWMRGTVRQQPAAKGSRIRAVARRHSAAAPQKPRRTPPIRRLPPGGGPLNVPAHASC